MTRAHDLFASFTMFVSSMHRELGRRNRNVV